MEDNLKTFQSMGGHARAASLTPEQRSAAARFAAEKRWAGKIRAERTGMAGERPAIVADRVQGDVLVARLGHIVDQLDRIASLLESANSGRDDLARMVGQLLQRDR